MADFDELSDSVRSSDVNLLGAGTEKKRRFEQFRAFFRILILIQIRKPLWLLVEVLTPLLFAGTMLATYHLIDVEKRSDKTYQKFPVFGNGLDYITPVDRRPLLLNSLPRSVVLYAPRNMSGNVSVDHFMEKLKRRYSWRHTRVKPLIDFMYPSFADLINPSVTVHQICSVRLPPNMTHLTEYCKLFLDFFNLDVKGFDSEAELVAYTKDPHNYNFIAGVIFNEISDSKLSYRLRFRHYMRNLFPDYIKGGGGTLAQTWKTGAVLPDGLSSIERHFPRLSDGGVPAYWREEFLTVQKAIDDVYLGDDTREVMLERFPYPSDEYHPIHSYATLLLPLVSVLSFLLTVVQVTRSIAIDKELGIKDYLSISGLKGRNYWGAYFCLHLLKATVPMIMLIILVVAIFPRSNFCLVATCYIIYMLNAIAFGCLVAIAIPRGTVAPITAAILWFLLNVLSVYLQKENGAGAGRVASFLLINPALTAAIQIIRIGENQRTGLQWNTVLRDYGGVSMADVYLFLLLDFILLITLSFLIRFPWRSLIDRVQTFLRKKYVNGSNQLSEGAPGVTVDRVWMKAFPTTILVSDVSFAAQPGKLTVLLGRNGSGKTSLLAAIAGGKKVWKGFVWIGPQQLSIHEESLRHLIGYCPQFDPIFPELTVAEHINFYKQIKSHSTSMDAILSKLNLTPKLHSQAKTLSGGMKRKLSLTISLCGNSKVLLLDEPTSGLDAEIRKEVSSLLMSERGERTIILATHYMDEADQLGDQIVLLHHGKLLASGNGEDFKNKTGKYFNVTITFHEEGLRTYGEAVRVFVQRFAPFAAIGQAEQNQLVIHIPVKNAYWPSLINLLEKLDQSRAGFGILRLKVAETSLEDAVQREVASQNSSDQVNARSDHQEEAGNPFLLENSSFSCSNKKTGLILTLRSFEAMFVKKSQQLRRMISVLLLQFIVPVVAVSIGMLTKSINPLYVPKPQPLQLDNFDVYKESVAYMKGPNASSGETFTNFSTHWRKNLETAGISIEPVNLEDSLRDKLLSLSKTEGASVFFRTAFFGMEMEEDGMTAFFNPVAPHSIASSLSAVSNSYASELGKIIETVNDPLPPSFLISTGIGEEFVLALSLCLGLVLSAALFTLLPTQERLSGVAHLQRMAGVHGCVYWSAQILWDLVMSCGVNILVLEVLRVGGVGVVREAGGWWGIFLLLSLHSLALLPLAYLGSFSFSTVSGGVSKLAILHLAAGLIPTVISGTLEAMALNSKFRSLKDTERSFSTVLSAIFPQFAFSKGFMEFYANRAIQSMCTRMNISCDDLGGNITSTNEYFRWETPGIGRWVMFLCLHAVVGFSLLALLQCSFRRKLRLPLGSAPLRFFPRGNSVLELSNVTVRHRNLPAPAVDSLSMSLTPGTCLCLLGHNGAGKSSLFRLLTGQIPIREGQAIVKNLSLHENFSEASRKIGYCPQQSSLLDGLTVKENLEVFARIRGLSREERKRVVSQLISALALKPHAHKLTTELSGGNRRKCSIAIALIGAPPLLLLDEPTSGVDPAGRLQIAALLNHVRKSDSSAILLSSHSLDVIESAANELAILNLGKLQFRGTLKEFLGCRNHFSLSFNTSAHTPINAVDAILANQLPKGHFQRTGPVTSNYRYKIDRSVCSWVEVLGIVSKMRGVGGVSDFVLLESFLDDYLSREADS